MEEEAKYKGLVLVLNNSSGVTAASLCEITATPHRDLQRLMLHGGCEIASDRVECVFDCALKRVEASDCREADQSCDQCIFDQVLATLIH